MKINYNCFIDFKYYLYFAPFLSPNIPGEICDRRNAIVTQETGITTDMNLPGDIIKRVFIPIIRMKCNVCNVSQLSKTL